MIHNTKHSLLIGWLYPELMSTYGDRGNIITLQKRCEWRGIDVEIKRLDLGFEISDLKACDMLFMGGAQDRQQTIVAKDLLEKKKALEEMIEDGTPGLYICGAYQFLGNYYKEADGTIIPGLDIFDLYTENPGENVERLIGNIVVSLDDNILRAKQSEVEKFSTSSNNNLVGFENHGGRTYVGEKVTAFGAVSKGFGNNGGDKTEGAIYKNSFGSYMHGPILPKNPHFADHLIKLALEKKYHEKMELKELNDDLEYKANKYIIQKLKVSI